MVLNFVSLLCPLGPSDMQKPQKSHEMEVFGYVLHTRPGARLNARADRVRVRCATGRVGLGPRFGKPMRNVIVLCFVVSRWTSCLSKLVKRTTYRTSHDVLFQSGSGTTLRRI